MKKILVVVYSRTGNNKYLAEKLAQRLDADIEAIRPRIKGFLFLILASLTRWSAGIRPLKHDIRNYNQVILCGPIWTGQFIAPLRDFTKKYLLCPGIFKHKKNSRGYPSPL